MGFFSCGFKFVRVDFGASKELIETRQEGKCEEKDQDASELFQSERSDEAGS